MAQIPFREESNKINYKYINQRIINNPNPFPRNPVASKDNLPQFCLGRSEEIGIIKNAIEKVSNDPVNKSAWIPINGDGGTGKSTVALYVYKKIRSRNSSDLKVDYLEGSYINIPADPKYLTIEYTYKKVLEDLGDGPENYPYFLGFNFVNKLCNIINNLDDIKEEFNRIFGIYWSKLSLCKDYKDFLITIKKKAPKFINELLKFTSEYDYLIQSKINLRLNYIQNLIKTLSENKDIRHIACKHILGDDIKDKEEARQMFENLIKTFNLLFNRSCIMIIMDNLENLGFGDEIFRELFTFLLAFRNNINNCLLLTIGSTKFWQFFRNVISMSEWNMIEGFKYDEITLMNLSEEDASSIMMRHITEFWDKYGSEVRPIGKDQNYPFSKSAFKYIYETHDRNLRDSLKMCNRIIERFKETNVIHYYKNIENAIHHLRPNTAGVYLFINEINYLLKFLKKFTDRNNLSRMVENGLMKAFLEIKEKQKEKYISNVEHDKVIILSNDKVCKPDVFLTLYGKSSIEDIRYAEIQVKAYFSTNYVKYNEVESSIEALKEGKTNFLHFITLSPLDKKILEELQKYQNRIGRVIPLEGEELAYLMLLLTDFSNIFFKKDTLDADVYIQILNKIGINIPEFFEKIRIIPPIEIKEFEKVILPPTTELIQISLPIEPISPQKKIYNPKELESHIINLFHKEQLIKKKEDVIEKMKYIAGSTSVINSALSSLQKLNKIKYSRQKPQGWSLV